METEACPPLCWACRASEHSHHLHPLCLLKVLKLGTRLVPAPRTRGHTAGVVRSLQGWVCGAGFSPEQSSWEKIPGREIAEGGGWGGASEFCHLTSIPLIL